MSFTTFSIISFHDLVLFIFTLPAVLPFSFLYSTFFSLTATQRQWFFCGPAATSYLRLCEGAFIRAFCLHKCHSHQLLCLLLASEMAFIKTKSIHFTIVLPEKCCSENQPLCVEAVCRVEKCCCIFELLLNLFGDFDTQVKCLFPSANLVFLPLLPLT